MHYFLLPMIPLTIAGAIFFKNRILAYSFPILLTLIKVAMTRPSSVYFFTALALFAVVFLTRKIAQNDSSISWIKVAGIAALSVVSYQLISGFGVWFLGGCLSEGQGTTLAISGLIASYKSAFSYGVFHFLKAVPSAVLLVLALQGIKRLNVAWNLQRMTSEKTSA